MDANMCQIDVNMYHMRANQHHVKHSAQFLLVIYVGFFLFFYFSFTSDVTSLQFCYWRIFSLFIFGQQTVCSQILKVVATWWTQEMHIQVSS